MAIGQMVRCEWCGAYLGDVEGVDEDGGDNGGAGRRDGPLREPHGALGGRRRRSELLRGSLRGGHGEEGEEEAVRATVRGGGRIDSVCIVAAS